jgi:hypothetical protein
VDLSGVLSIAAIIISLATFAVTYYEQYLKAAKLQLVLGRELWLSYGHGDVKLGFWASVVVTNLGALDAVVLDINGTLTGPDGRQAQVDWYVFGDFAPNSSEFVSRGLAETLVAPSRKASTCLIGFSVTPTLPSTRTDSQATASAAPILKSGVDYTLALNVVVPRRRAPLFGLAGRPGEAQRTAVTWSGSFKLSSDAAAYLAGSRVAEAAGQTTDAQRVQLTGDASRRGPQNATAAIPGAGQLDRVRDLW